LRVKAEKGFTQELVYRVRILGSEKHEPPILTAAT